MKLFLDTENLGQVWGLFHEMGSMPGRVTHAPEIINSARNGNIAFTDFNLPAYEQTSQRKSYNPGDIKKDRGDKELYISSDFEDEDGGRSKGTVPEGLFGEEDKELESFLERRVAGESRAVLVELCKSLMDYGYILPEYLNNLAWKSGGSKHIPGQIDKVLNDPMLETKAKSAIKSYISHTGSGIDGLNDDVREYLYRECAEEAYIDNNLSRGVVMFNGRRVFNLQSLSAPGTIWFMFDGEFIRPKDITGEGYLPLFDFDVDDDDEGSSFRSVDGASIIEVPLNPSTSSLTRAVIECKPGDAFKTAFGLMELTGNGKLKPLRTP